MKDFKNKIIDEREKNFTYETIKKLTNTKNIIKKCEDFYSLGAEHALKKPLNDMTDKIIEILDKHNEDETEVITDDVSIINGVLSFRRNLVPALPQDQFNDLQAKLNSHKELADIVKQKEEEIARLGEQIEDFKAKKKEQNEQKMLFELAQNNKKAKGSDVVME